MKRYLNLFIATLLLFILLPSYVLAGTLLNASAKLGPQYPWNKHFKVIVSVKPTTDLQRINIIWFETQAVKYNRNGIILKNLKKGKTYSYTFDVIPKSAGAYTLHANIVGYTSSDTIADSVDIPITLKSNLALTNAKGYTGLLISYWIGILATLLVFGFGLYKLGMFLYKDFIPKWIAKQQAKPV